MVIIRRLAIKNKWTHQSVKDVAEFAVYCGATVPSTDPKTILGTCRTPIENDEFQHFGLIKRLGYKMRHGLKDGGGIIFLQAHIDGISIYNKSKRGVSGEERP